MYAVVSSDQMNGCKRNTQSDGYLRAAGAELEKPGKLRVDQPIIFVATVIADLLAQQATAYSDGAFPGLSFMYREMSQPGRHVLPVQAGGRSA